MVSSYNFGLVLIFCVLFVSYLFFAKVEFCVLLRYVFMCASPGKAVPKMTQTCEFKLRH